MTDYGERRRPAIDPLLSGVEAVAAGYRTVEYVFDAFAESLRRRPGTGYERKAPAFRRYARAAGPQPERAGRMGPMAESPTGRRGAGGAKGYGSGQSKVPTIPAGGGLADLAIEFLDFLGEAAQEIAGGIGGEIFGEDVPRLEPHGVPGDDAKLKFRFTNTGSSVLTGLGFEPTALFGATGEIEAGAVSFKGLEPGIQIKPGGSVLVDLVVAVPRDQLPGIYRGVIAARSTLSAGRHRKEAGPDAWALVELEVAATDATHAIAGVEPEGS